MDVLVNSVASFTPRTNQFAVQNARCQNVRGAPLEEAWVEAPLNSSKK
jgi:hypothetical protein